MIVSSTNALKLQVCSGIKAARVPGNCGPVAHVARWTERRGGVLGERASNAHASHSPGSAQLISEMSL